MEDQMDKHLAALEEEEEVCSKTVRRLHLCFRIRLHAGKIPP